MKLMQLELAEQNAYLRYREAQRVADELCAIWSMAFARYREVLEDVESAQEERQTACDWLRAEGISMFGEVN